MEHDKPVHPLPKEGELVAFEHGAAGHEGISSNAAGDLIIKPCTQAEIDFYEAARVHPDLQAHMPVFMGKLELGNQKAVQFMTPVRGQGGPAPSSTNPLEVEALIANPSADVQSDGDKRKSKVWIPSGGKKLETGLAIALENAAVGFKKPNVIDLKLGARLWDDNAPEEKRKKLDQVAARTTSGSLGFRVAGAKVWLGDLEQYANKEENTEIKHGYKSYNKLYGQSLNEKSVEIALARILSGVHDPRVVGKDKILLGSPQAGVLTKRLIKELESIQYVLEHEESRMYSASVLVVIEGDQQALEEAMAEENKIQEGIERHEVAGVPEEDADQDEKDEDDDGESIVGPRVMEVRLIDFAHASFTPGQGPDENALEGVRNIIKVLRDIST